MKTVRKIKIAIGCDSYFPVVNGVIEVVKNQFDYFNQHFETRLLIPKYKNCQYDHLNHMYQIRSIKGRGKCRGAFPNIDHGFKKYLEAFRPDVIHIHSPFNVGKHCLKYAKKHNIPVVFTFHTKFKDDFKRLLPFKWLRALMMHRIMHVINNVTQVYTVNPAMLPVMKEYGYTRQGIVIDNATDLVPFTNREQINQEINKKWNISPTDNVFVYVGRILKYKGIKIIVDALVLYQKYDPNFKMFFVGEGNDLSWLKKYVNKRGTVSNNIIFTGLIENRTELSKIYNRADLSLLPSLFDSVSLTLFEAACFKVPTVTVKDASIAKRLQSNNGFVLPNDPESYASGLHHIMSDQQKLNRVRENTYNTLYITWSKICQIYEKEYRRLIAQK